MTALGETLKEAGGDVATFEAAAQQVVGCLDQALGDGAGGKACALVRLYKTHPFAELDEGLQSFARGILGDTPPAADLKCLTLVATQGREDPWNDRHKSQGHKAIPLPSVQVIESIPMLAQLIQQFGLEISDVVKPDPKLLPELEQKSFNVFHVPDAQGSPYVPAQDFVEKHQVRSALGFGGALPGGELFAVIMFCKTHVSKDVAGLFKTLALSAKMGLLPAVGKPLFG